MTFATTREAYDAYMGRYANRLAPVLIAYWEPFTSGVGPGGYCVSLDPDRRPLREECRRRLGDPDDAFTLSATAWAVKGRAPT